MPDANQNPTYEELINDAIAQGPLPGEEASRRAEILVYNELNDIFERLVANLANRPTAHPETRQVMAGAATLVEVLAEEMLKPMEEETDVAQVG